MTESTVYRTESHFNTVYVLEALAEGELKTGRNLYESVLLPAQHSLDGFFAEYHPVRTPGDLGAVLAMIANDCTQYGRGPIIHVDAHGTADGLALPGGQSVKWRQLASSLAQINEACRMNLMVVASMCGGWALTEALMPADRSPVFGLIGPPEDISAGELGDAIIRLYSTLVQRLDWNDALAAMNHGLPFEKWSIRPATAEILFCRVFRLYQSEMTTGSALQDRENELVANLARERGLDLNQTMMIRPQIRQMLESHSWWYNHLRRPFLMLDLFPENEARFGLSYDKCFEGVA